jgi:hypothetical protein
MFWVRVVRVPVPVPVLDDGRGKLSQNCQYSRTGMGTRTNPQIETLKKRHHHA